MEMVTVEKICSHCNKEFTLDFSITHGGKVLTHCMANCPDCDKRNDTWIKITLTETKTVSNGK